MQAGSAHLIVAMMWLVGACGGVPPETATDGAGLDVTIMSYNILWAEGPPLMVFGNALTWDDRRDAVIEILGDDRLDVVGLQEAMPAQVQDVLAASPQWGAHSTEAEFNGVVILYRTDRFRVVEADRFWLSATPDVQGSFVSGERHVCAWLRLEALHSQHTFYVYDLHLSTFATAHDQSAELLARRIDQRLLPAPVLVTGDFNAREASPELSYLTGQTPLAGMTTPQPLADTFRSLHPEAFASTLAGTPFPQQPPDLRIDFILSSRDVELVDATIRNDVSTLEVWPSDHLPITATVNIAGR